MKEVAEHCGQARRRALTAATGSTDQLLFTALYAGLLDGAERLQIGSWGLARRLFPVPPAAPTETSKLHAYLAGYLEGHALLALVHAAWRRRENPWDAARLRISAIYATAVASPKAQAKLILPSEKTVLAVHHFASAMAGTTRDPLDWQTELDLFRWLAGRSGLVSSSALEDRLLRQRSRRLERLEPPAA